ncbi:MAG TPA: phosphate/phosphite/phosphonate ABC transporter substrate-binding protein [Mucilaginibacter sp.]
MALKKANIAFVLLLMTCLAFLGCRNKAALDANGVPGKLVFAMYQGDNPGQTKSAMEPLRLYLQKKLGMDVEFIYTTDYSAVIEAMRSKKVHIANLTPFAYIIATRQPGFTPIATLGLNGKPTTYHSIIMTNPQTGLKTMADVKARAKNLTLCFADPASTSGHLVPRAYLNSIGLNPDVAFKQAIFAGNHAASILSVTSGKIDLGCTSGDLSLDKLIREGIVKREEAVILWTSPPIANDVITVRSDLNKDFIKKMQDAFLSVAHDDFAALYPYAKLYYPNATQISYVAAPDSQYNGLRHLAGNIKDFKLN